MKVKKIAKYLTSAENFSLGVRYKSEKGRYAIAKISDISIGTLKRVYGNYKIQNIYSTKDNLYFIVNR
jgi:hypothetical protein